MRSVFEPLVEASRLPERLKRGVRSLGVTDDLQRAVRIYAVFQAEEQRALLRGAAREALAEHDVAAPLRPFHEEAAHLTPLGRMLYTDTRLWLVDDLLLVADKLSMAHGLELRVPFLDHRLVELLEGFEDRQKLRVTPRGFVTKHVHREAMARRLPQSILQRKKRGFTNPMDVWLREGLAPMVKERLLGDSPLHDIMERDAIARLDDAHRRGARDHRRQLFLLLGLDSWMRNRA